MEITKSEMEKEIEALSQVPPGDLADIAFAVGVLKYMVNFCIVRLELIGQGSVLSGAAARAVAEDALRQLGEWGA